MNSVLIFYHKDIHIYNERWIKRYVKSIENQTYKDFDIIELNYGKDNKSIKDLFKEKLGGYKFISQNFKDHSIAQRFLLKYCMNYDIIFNSNIDDFYHEDRFKLQYDYLTNNLNVGVVSSNFYYVNEDDTIINKMELSKKDIDEEFRKGNNIICNPSVAIRNFIVKDYGLNYKDEVPVEDFNFFIRVRNAKIPIHILDDYLVYYRRHIEQTTQKEFIII